MAHIHEKIDFTVETFIVYKDRVLLRFHDKYKFWCSVGGHIELEEDPNQAALREIKEEVGLDVELWKGQKRFHTTEPTFDNLIPPVGMNRHRASPGHEHVTLVYFATTQSDQLTLEHPADECRWVSHAELDEMDLKENILEYARAALKTLAT